MSLTETVKVSISSPDRFYIGGDWVKPSSSDEIDVINASTEDVFLRVAEAKAEDMDRAIAAAREAFDHGPWPRMSHADRAEYLVKIAAALEERALEIGSDLVRPDGRVEHHCAGERSRPRAALAVLRRTGRGVPVSRAAHAHRGRQHRPAWCGSPLGSSAPSSPGTARWASSGTRWHRRSSQAAP